MREIRLQAFGRVCRLVLDDKKAEREELISLCSEELSRLESKFSAFHPDSIVSRLNECAGTGSFVELDAEGHSLFDFVDALWGQSKHLFDPTTRILLNCYDASGRLRASREQLAGMIKLVGLAHLERDARGAHMTRKGMQIDLNSCVRPYAVDCLRKLLLRHGVEHALIELDQEVASIGKQPGGANWLIGVRLPKSSSFAIERIKLNNMCYAMRGNFELSHLVDGERFGRALSPIDGQPLPGLLAVGITADTCLAACSAASIARLKTEAAGLKWLDQIGMPWVAVDRNLRCHGTLAPASSRR